MGGVDAAKVGKLDSQLKLCEADAREPKRVIFVGLVVEHTNVDFLYPREIHEIFAVVDIFRGIVVTVALFLDIGVHTT